MLFPNPESRIPVPLMPLFRYKALSAAGESLDGQMEAGSAAEVISKLQDAGNIPLEAKPADDAGGGGLAGLFKRSEMSSAQVNGCNRHRPAMTSSLWR